MNASQTQYDISQLLMRAGATLRGNHRADCPKCGKRRTISHTHEVFTCHEATCDFRGNVVTLAKELGLLKPLSPREAGDLKRTRERARRAAEEFAFRLRERSMPLRQEHRQMLDILYGGMERLKRDRDPKIGQAIIAYAKRKLRKIRAELALVEDAPMPTRLKFLNANEGRQKGMISEVIAGGGLSDVNGTFIEVEF